MDKEESLSEDDELVQTFRRSERPPKAGVKFNDVQNRSTQETIMVVRCKNIIGFNYSC